MSPREVFVARWATLTGKQQRVLWDRCQGYSRKQVAAREGIAEPTAMKILGDAYKKLPRNGSDDRPRSLWVCYMIGSAGVQQ